MRRFLLVVAMCCFAVPAFAEDSPEPAQNPEVEEGKALLVEFLDAAIKATEGRKPKAVEVSRKLSAVKKYIHPKTLALIAQQEKRKVVTNALALSHWAKNDYWLVEYEVKEVKPAGKGILVVEVNEKNWRVEEGGTDGEFEPTSYLLGKNKGKWTLVDKRRNTSFTADAITVGYKDYFEAPAAPPAKAEDAAQEDSATK